MSLYYQDFGITLHHGDCIEVMSTMPDNSFDSIVTDPPYGLGFMGKAWDALPPGEEWARECLRVLKPGGHMLAFGGTRTWHRLAVAVEDAGFEIRDSIAWMYSSGFPKSMDVSKAIDKAGGDTFAFREFARTYANSVKSSSMNHSDIDRHLGIKSSSSYWGRKDHRGGMPPRHHWEAVRELLELPAGLSSLYDEAEREVIGTRKQRGSQAETAAAFNSCASEVESLTAPATPAAQKWAGWGTSLKPAFEPVVVARKPFKGTVAASVLEYGTGAINIDASRIDSEAGRWPANVILDESQAAALDDSAKFFYCAKAPKSERPVVDGTAHPTVKPLALMRYLCRLVTPVGGTILDPFAGSGTTIEAARGEGFDVIGIEREADYLPLIQHRIDRYKANA